jgi:hypothetical protein
MAISGREIWFWSKAALVAGAAGWATSHFSLLVGIGIPEIRNGAGVIAQLSGTMLGFVLAALAILLTVVNTRLIRNMQRTGHFSVLLRRMLICLLSFGATTVAGAAFLFAPQVTLPWCSALIALTLFSVVTLGDVCWKFWVVLHNLSPAP